MALSKCRIYFEPVRPFADDHPGYDRVIADTYYTAFACLNCTHAWLDSRRVGDQRPISCRQCLQPTGLPLDLYLQALEYPDC